MARFYTDEDPNGRIVSGLRELGHDVQRARDVFFGGAADYRHLHRAAIEERILITHNRDDFLLLHGALRFWRSTSYGVRLSLHYGILAVPQPHQMPPESVAYAIDEEIRALGALTNRFLRLDVGDGWTPETG
ncbi:MAG TPA: DUF5615 family PIN-like protein [Thermomicrobiaceae bacterium]|nr:DUF5615 family PIN-like protein [Thermomicrobiaceae bacterium]